MPQHDAVPSLSSKPTFEGAAQAEVVVVAVTAQDMSMEEAWGNNLLAGPCQDLPVNRTVPSLGDPSCGR